MPLFYRIRPFCETISVVATRLTGLKTHGYPQNVATRRKLGHSLTYDLLGKPVHSVLPEH
jgi:hypothetical protein